MRNGVSYLVYIYTLGAGRILITSIIIVCLLNLMAWKASWAHRTGENEKKDNDKIKKVGPNVERLCLYRKAVQVCIIPYITTIKKKENNSMS